MGSKVDREPPHFWVLVFMLVLAAIALAPNDRTVVDPDRPVPTKAVKCQ